MNNVKNLESVSVPIFVVFADGDSTISNFNTVELIESNKNIQSVEIFDTNHNSVLNNSQTKYVIKDFIERSVPSN